VFRIHFTAEDLTRTRFTLTYGPLAETIFGLAYAAPSRNVVNDWQRRTLLRVGHWAGPTVRVAQFCGYVDLITVAGSVPDLDEGLEVLVATGPDVLQTEVSAGVRQLLRRAGGYRRRTPPWWDLARNLPKDYEARKGLAGTLRRCADATVAPYWDGIRAHLAQEVARRSQQMAVRGLGAVLGTLHTGFRWNSPVLEVDWGGPERRDFHLQGRGLELVPSLFYREAAPPHVHTADESASPVLFYPAPTDVNQAHQIFGSVSTDGNDRALADLLGRTRATVLKSLTDECNTTELAKRTGLSLAGASQHAAVLRNAGLVVSQRAGGAMLHSLTTLGHLLLEHA
jgi:DNA-binding transcriptional ArsR family regulator